MSANSTNTSHDNNHKTQLLLELQERNQRLKILSDVASTLLLADNPRDVVEAVFNMLSAHLGLEAYFNYLLVEDGSHMWLANYRGILPEKAEEIKRLDFGQAVCGRVARDRARIIVEDVQHSDDPRTDLIRSLGITAYCCHPLIAHDKLLGTLSFGTRSRVRFTPDEIELMKIVCNLTASALERQRSEKALLASDEKLRRANRALKTLATCKKAMIRAEDEATLLTDICHIVVDEGGYRMAWIGYVENDEARTVRAVACAGYDAGYVDSLKIALEDPVRGNGPTGISMKTGKTVVTGNVKSNTRMEPWRNMALERGYLSTLNLPIIYAGHVIGVLVIYSGESRAFDGEEQKLLFELASILAYGITAIRDRNKRIEAEEALRASEERFDYALKAAQEGIWDWNMETDEVYYSPRYKEMLGYSEGEIELHASAWVRLMHPDDRERALRVVDAVMRGEREYEIEFRMRHKDGHYVDILSRGYPIRRQSDGKITRIVGTHFDITERNRVAEELRQARDNLEKRVLERTAELQRSNSELTAQIEERKRIEKARLESEERFRTLADNIPNLAWMANADGWIFWYNKQWYDYTGTTLEEMQGWGWQKVHHPDFVKTVTEEWSTRIKEGKPYDNVFPLRGKDGNYRWFLTRVTPIRDAEGNVVRWFGTNTDITERKRAETELADAKALAELYVDLMGHDINNMNMVAMGYLELAKDTVESEGKLDSSNMDLLNGALDNINKSSTLISNVRKLQRGRSGDVKLEAHDLGAVVKGVCEQFKSVPDRYVHIACGTVDGIHVRTDDLLRDVFVNLVDNAIKHSTGPAYVNIRMNRENKDGRRYYAVSVEDNGPGIPDGMKDKVFNRLHRGDTKAKGSGLGLYLVKTLVESYGGLVWVEDRVKGNHTNGSRFVVMLPAVE